MKGEQVRSSPRRRWQPFTSSPPVAQPVAGRRASPWERRRRSFCFKKLNQDEFILVGECSREAPPTPFLFMGESRSSYHTAGSLKLPRAEVIREQMGKGNELLRRGTDSHSGGLLGSCQSKRGYELSLLIQHVDLMASRACDAPVGPSAAAVSDATEQLNGTEAREQ